MPRRKTWTADPQIQTYGPKHHCEPNAIESLWYAQKGYVRWCNNQNFDKITKLIPESGINFVETILTIPGSSGSLCHRQMYGDVLKPFSGQFCKTIVQSHCRITNTNIDKKEWKFIF